MYDDITGYLLFYGYNIKYKKIELNNTILKYMQDISELTSGISVMPKVVNNKEELEESVRSFLSNKYKLHKIGILTDSVYCDKIIDKNIRFNRDIIKTFNKSATFVDPFDMDVEYWNDSVDETSLEVQIPVIDDYDILKHINVYYKRISLPRKIYDMTPIFYTHELIHSQINKGSIKDYCNRELLPIFNELLYAYEKDKELFKKQLVFRIDHLLTDFYSLYNKEQDKSFEILELQSYYISILKAINLLYKYINGDKKVIEYINKVFNKNTKLEHMLDKLSITDNNIYNKRLVKELLN